MTYEQYMYKIRDATQKLGVYREEFLRARSRLAAVYVRIETMQRAMDAGEFSDMDTVPTKAGEMTDPRVQQLDSLLNLALNYEKALGLTADSVRKINPEIFAPKDDKPADPFVRMFKGGAAG